MLVIEDDCHLHWIREPLGVAFLLQVICSYDPLNYSFSDLPYQQSYPSGLIQLKSQSVIRPLYNHYHRQARKSSVRRDIHRPFDKIVLSTSDSILDLWRRYIDPDHGSQEIVVIVTLFKRLLSRWPLEVIVPFMVIGTITVASPKRLFYRANLARLHAHRLLKSIIPGMSMIITPFMFTTSIVHVHVNNSRPPSARLRIFLPAL